tara:strand:- start:481 stop:855 length:375 start_codon:yes stop_codon:yes gene_type:complete
MSVFMTFEAAGTITEYAAVKLDSDNKIVVTTTAVEPSIIGIAQEAATSGDKINVCVSGQTRMVAGATITPATANQLMADASGQMKDATATHFVVGSALPSTADVAYASGEQFIGIFTPPSIVKA